MLFGQARVSNAVVESWFNIVKNVILQHSHPVAIASFIRLMKMSVLGRLRDALTATSTVAPVLANFQHPELKSDFSNAVSDSGAGLINICIGRDVCELAPVDCLSFDVLDDES